MFRPFYQKNTITSGSRLSRLILSAIFSQSYLNKSFKFYISPLKLCFGFKKGLSFITILIALFFIISSQNLYAKKNRASLSHIKNWAYLKDLHVDIDALNNSGYELIVIDYSYDGTDNTAYSKKEIKSLRPSKKVLAYISIGSAQNQRFYFKTHWQPGNPSYLSYSKDQSESDYNVQYWEKRWWKKAIKPYLKKIIKAGFDGVVLDDIDAYENWVNLGYSDINQNADRMARLVKKIAKFSRKKSKLKKKFIICPLNGLEILDNLSNKWRKKYIKKIDAVMAESIFYNYLDSEEQNYRLSLLRQFYDAGKTIFNIEYISEDLKEEYFDKISFSNVNMDIIGFSPDYIDQTSYQKKDYLGMSLPADFQMFCEGSFWTTPIPDNPNVAPESSTMITKLKSKSKYLYADFDQWTITLHVIDSQYAPLIDVQSTDLLYPTIDPDQNRIAENVPIPVEAWPDPKEDGHMILLDPVLRKAWDFSMAVKKSSSSWQASIVDVWDP